MATFRTYGQIVKSMRDRLRLTQINLDTKEGTVARDLFIDPQSDELSRLYRLVSAVSDEQDPSTSSGEALKRWARNFGITLDQGTYAQGLAVFLTSIIDSDQVIPDGSIITSRSGLQFRVIGNHSFNVVDKNSYAATANRLRSLLNQIGSTDVYALEVPVVSVSSGTSGNIGSFQLSTHSLPGSFSVTNLKGFSGGTNAETNEAFRSKIFTAFSGSGTGTADGYRRVALATPNVIDAKVVSSGNALMLRDGTQIIKTADGNVRILNSGSGGKVDMYIIGSNPISYTDTFVYTNRSGSGGAVNQTNSFVPGYAGFDKTLTNEELRINSFRTGVLPAQPISSVTSVVGSQSGVLAQLVYDANGNAFGNYELVKDTSPVAGGSPFGADSIVFTSSVKAVTAEALSKGVINGVSSLKYTEATALNLVYQDMQILKENSKVSPIDRTAISLNHFPVTTASRVFNKTTGETYVISNQNLDPNTSLNLSGIIYISGKSLPSQNDVLEVDYTWRAIFDPYIDFNGSNSILSVTNNSIVDAIDWGVGSSVRGKMRTITKTPDNLEYIIDLTYPASRALSVYTKVVSSSSVGTVTLSGVTVSSISLSLVDPVIDNIISIKTANGVELYTSGSSFSGRVIYLSDTSPTVVGESVTVEYNKVEFYNLPDGNGTVVGTRITLPSSDILSGNNLLSLVDAAYLAGDPVYVDYVMNNPELIPSENLSSLPITSDFASDGFLTSTLLSVSGGVQPVLFSYDSFGAQIGILKNGPSRMIATISGTSTSGTVRILGTTLTRMIIDVDAGTSLTGLTLNLESALLSTLGVSSLPANMFIARVDSVSDVNKTRIFDLTGTKLAKSTFSCLSAEDSATTPALSFTMPSSANNNSFTFTAGEVIRVSTLVGIDNDFEDLYFGQDGEVISNKVFGRVNRVSVSSGFRDRTGVVSGAISVLSFNQPKPLIPYFVDYEFTAPKEGELITVTYNYNSTIGDVSVSTNIASPVTADVIVKEGFALMVDVYGEIVVNSQYQNNANTVIENVTKAINGMLASGFGGIIDYSDVISVGTSIPGVDSMNISIFNESGQPGRRTFISTLDNQYIAPGTVSFSAISRKDFRIS